MRGSTVSGKHLHFAPKTAADIMGSISDNTCIYREYWREVAAFVKKYTSVTSS